MYPAPDLAPNRGATLHVLLLAVLAGTGVVILTTLVDDPALQILTIGAGLALGIILTVRRYLLTTTLVMMTASLIASSRLRASSTVFHEGGAELAIAPFDVLLIALLLIWLTWIIGNRRLPLFRPTIVDAAILVFLIVHALSIMVSQLPVLTLLEFLRLLKMVVLVFLLRLSFQHAKQIQRIVLVLLFNALFVSGLGLAEWTLKRTFGLGFLGERDTFWVASLGTGQFIGRVGATLGHPNALSTFLVALLPLALVLFLLRLNRSITAFALLTLSFGLVGLLLTFARAGWLAASVTVGAILLLHPFVFGRSRQWLAVIGVLAVVACLILLLFGDLIALRLFATSSNSELLRIQLGTVALAMFRDRPLLGVGLNTFVELLPAYDTTGISRVVQAPVHNIFLIYLAEAGVMGVLAYLSIFGSLLLAMWRSIRRSTAVLRAGNQRVRLLVGLEIGLTAGIIAIFIQGMLDWLFRYDPIFLLVWFMIGLFLAADRLLDRQLQSSDQPHA